MEPSVDPFAPESLLSHGRFVRALARSLLADEHAAEDVAQETWVRYLERPPRSALDPRGWLAAVVRNLASNARRDRDRRSEREARATLVASPTPEGDDLSQAEILRAVVDSVLALDEPYRSVVLARYFRGWEPKRIASETHVPVATVKSRLQRALAMLRERLDREHGGREAWGLALAPFAELGGVASSTVAWKFAVASALLATPTYLVWKGLAGRPATVPPPIAQSVPAASDDLGTPRIDAGATPPLRTVAAPVAAAANSGTIRISGKVVNLPYPEQGIAGGPAAGLELSISPSFFAGPSSPKFGHMATTTREDGSFDLEFPRPEKSGGTYSLSSKADETWRSLNRQLEFGAEEVARDGIQLARGAHGVLHGIVVDAGGIAVAGARMRLRATMTKSVEEREFAADDHGAFSFPWTAVNAVAESVDPSSTVVAFDRLVAREAGGWEAARIVLASAAALHLRVVDAGGRGVPELDARADLSPGERCTQGIVRSWFDDSVRKHGKTDEHGEVDIAGVWAGHQIVVGISDQSSASQRSGEVLFDGERGSGEPIVLAAGEVRTLLVRWTGDLRIVGRTLTRDGKPISDVGLQFTDIGVTADSGGEPRAIQENGSDGTSEPLGLVQSGSEGAFEAHFKPRALHGPVRIVAREKSKPESGRPLLDLGYAGELPPSDGAIGSRVVELSEVVDGVLHADVVLEPGLSITGRVFDSNGKQLTHGGPSGHRIWVIATGGSLLDAQRAFGETGTGFDAQGRFTVIGLKKGDYDLFVSEEIRSFYTWPCFIHRFSGVPAGSEGLELRLPPREEVHVKIRTHGEGVERELVLHGRLSPRDPERVKRAADAASRVSGVDGWPVGATLGFGGCGGAIASEGDWSYGFYDTKEIEEHALQPMEPGWFVFGIEPSAGNSDRKWFPQATEPRWYGPGEYTIDFYAVPTATIDGRILADATREHVGVDLVTEDGGRVPLETQVGSGEPGYVVETDAGGRFVIRRAPVGKFRLRAGNVAELEHGKYRSETRIEVGESGISGLEIRF